MAFSLFLIFGFWGFSNFMIPRIEPAPPPVEVKLDLGSMTMDKYIALGEKLFNGKGTCTLCHNTLGRAPMLDQVVTLTPARLKDSRYKGKATDLESYLLESLIDPSAFVVAGFGKAGTADSESPMPNVTSGSIGLSDVETHAVIAYLQDLGGAEVTVKIPSGAEDIEDKEETLEAKQGPLGTAEEIVGKYGCGACHKIAGQVGAIGPDLSNIGASRDSNYLRRAILDPNVDIASGYPANLMPANYGAQLFARELEILVTYMTASTAETGEVSEAVKQVKGGPADTPTDAGGEGIMVQHGCGACHKFGTQLGAIGPDLTNIGAIRSSGQLRSSIVDPNAEISDGFSPDLMPPVYASQLSREELDTIVAYLAGLK